MKRILALILTLILLVSNVNVLAASDSGAFKEDYYIEAGEVLKAIGVAENANGTSIDADVTRMDLLKMVIRAVCGGVSMVPTGRSSAFSDVSEADGGYIEYALMKGMILQDEKTFSPNANADLDFAKKIMTGAAGYDIKGGLYKKTAVEIGVCTNLRAESGTSFKAGDAYTMIYNLITTVSVRRSSGKTYEFADTSILESVYNVIGFEGIFIADENTSADGIVCGTKQVRIQYKNSNTSINLFYSGMDTAELLGRRVMVYYNENDEAISIYPIDDDDVLAEFDGLSYLGFDEDSREISWAEPSASNYWEQNSVEKSEKITKDFEIIFNGKYTTAHSFVMSLLKGEMPYNIKSVQLIDSKNVGKANLIKIEAYKTVMVASANAKTLELKCKMTGDQYDFDAVYENAEVFVYDDKGSEKKFSDIKNNSVVEVYDIPDDEKSVKIVISSKTNSAIVSSVYEEEGKKYVVANGVEYIVSETAKDVIDLKAGKNYKIYLDSRNLVAGYAISGGSDIAGVITARMDTENDGVIKLKVFTLDGTIIESTTADKWYFNNSLVDMNDEGKLVYKTAEGGTKGVLNDLKGCLIQYVLDGNGKFKQIRTPRVGAPEGELGYSWGMNTYDKIEKAQGQPPFQYRKEGLSIGGFSPNWQADLNGLAMDENTVSLTMPAKTVTDDREKLFATGIVWGEEKYYCGYTLSGPDDMIADIIVEYIAGAQATLPSASGLNLVTGISQALNNNEEVGYKVDMITIPGMSKKSVVTEKLELLKVAESTGNLTGETIELNIGDVVLYAANTLGDAVGFCKHYDIKDPAGLSYQYMVSEIMDQKRRFIAAPYRVDGQYMALARGTAVSDANVGSLEIHKATEAIIVDKNADEADFVRKGTLADVMTFKDYPTNYSKLYIHSKYGNVMWLLVYNNF